VRKFVVLSFVLPVNSANLSKDFNYDLISLYSIGYLSDNSGVMGNCAVHRRISGDGFKVLHIAIKHERL
jgi:hypothetical protein